MSFSNWSQSRVSCSPAGLKGVEGARVWSGAAEPGDRQRCGCGRLCREAQVVALRSGHKLLETQQEETRKDTKLQ